MKARFCSLFVMGAAIASARGDLTVQTLDAPGASANQITIYTKGDKMRMDTAPQVSTIIDGKTGEIGPFERLSNFAIPADYREVKGPEMLLPGQSAPAAAPAPR